MIPQNLVKVGYIIKPYGIDGTVIIRITDDTAEELYEGDFLFIGFDGTKIPFFIESIHWAGDNLRVKFADADSEKEADQLRGREIFASSGKKSNEINPELLHDFTFTDKTSGFCGRVEAYHDNATNPLLTVSTKEGEFLLPFHEDFILNVDLNKRELEMQWPVGIFFRD